jgi:hypothetical protein
VHYLCTLQIIHKVWYMPPFISVPRILLPFSDLLKPANSIEINFLSATPIEINESHLLVELPHYESRVPGRQRHLSPYHLPPLQWHFLHLKNIITLYILTLLIVNGHCSYDGVEIHILVGIFNIVLELARQELDTCWLMVIGRRWKVFKRELKGSWFHF